MAHAVDIVQGPEFSNFPVAKEDVALIVDSGVHAADVAAALRSGAGPLLESVRLFDVYEGAQVGDGKKSLGLRAAFPGAGSHPDRGRGPRGGRRCRRRGRSAGPAPSNAPSPIPRIVERWSLSRPRSSRLSTIRGKGGWLLGDAGPAVEPEADAAAVDHRVVLADPLPVDRGPMP